MSNQNPSSAGASSLGYPFATSEHPIHLFPFEGQSLRVADQHGEPWFVLKNLLSMMGTSRTTAQAVSSINQHLGDGYTNDIPIPDALGRMQPTTIVAEPAATFLVSRSNTEVGRRLNRFIHTEVLPALRKQGRFETKPSPTKRQRSAHIAPEPSAPALDTIQVSKDDYIALLEARIGRSYRVAPVATPAPKVRKPARRPLTPAEEAEILERYTAGETKSAIARAIGRDHKVVARALERANGPVQNALRLEDNA